MPAVTEMPVVWVIAVNFAGADPDPGFFGGGGGGGGGRGGRGGGGKGDLNWTICIISKIFSETRGSGSPGPSPWICPFLCRESRTFT